MKVREVFENWYVENAGIRIAEYFRETGVLDRNVVRIAKDGYTHAVVFDGRHAAALFKCIVTSNQQIQKTNRYGTARHRAAYSFIRQAVQIFHGKNIGEY